MRLKLITTTSDVSKCHNLERSLKHFGWDYHFIQHEWTGFLSKIHETYNYLKSLTDYTHFLYTDAWDTFALGNQQEAENKLRTYETDTFLISAERACYPHPEKESLYPIPFNNSPWRYVNGGGWGGSIAKFLQVYEGCPPTNELNDQVWLTDQFLTYANNRWMKLDYECLIFQTVAFCPETDFVKAQGRLMNTVTGRMPIFFHGNGHTPINHIYEMI